MKTVYIHGSQMTMTNTAYMKTKEHIHTTFSKVDELLTFFKDKLGMNWTDAHLNFLQYRKGAFVFNCVGWTDDERPIEFFVVLNIKDDTNLLIENIMSLKSLPVFIYDEEINNITVTYPNIPYKSYGKYHFHLN